MNPRVPCSIVVNRPLQTEVVRRQSRQAEVLTQLKLQQAEVLTRLYSYDDRKYYRDYSYEERKL